MKFLPELNVDNVTVDPYLKTQEKEHTNIQI